MLAKRKSEAPPKAAPPYDSRIIKAGALLADTKTMLSHWDLEGTVDANLEQIQRENPFGKASRARVRDMLNIFRKRYLADDQILRSLVILLRGRFPSASLDPILYFHSACSDRLLHDVVTGFLASQHAAGKTDINVLEVDKQLTKWAAEGKTKGQWSPPTIRRISQGLLATLRDFGVLKGSMKKHITPIYLPIETFAYIACYLKQHQPSGAKLIASPEWRLFFLGREGVERSLFEAHQRDLLEYHVAGSVSRLTFPAETLEEYAHVLAQR